MFTSRNLSLFFEMVRFVRRPRRMVLHAAQSQQPLVTYLVDACKRAADTQQTEEGAAEAFELVGSGRTHLDSAECIEALRLLGLVGASPPTEHSSDLGGMSNHPISLPAFHQMVWAAIAKQDEEQQSYTLFQMLKGWDSNDWITVTSLTQGASEYGIQLSLAEAEQEQSFVRDRICLECNLRTEISVGGYASCF